MANFDMVPPDANEVFGFNGPDGIKPTFKPDWQLILVGVILIAGLIYFNQRKKINELKKDISLSNR